MDIAEINGTNGLAPIGQEFQPAETQIAGKDRQADTKAAETDKVELSSLGKDISRFNDLVNTIPDDRDLRIEEVRSSIENSTYNVKGEQVADKILGGNLLNGSI